MHQLFNSTQAVDSKGGTPVSTDSNPVEELKRHIAEGIQTRQHRVIFQKNIEALWPCKVTEERKKQIREIEAFAEENGWSVRIRDAGISATFRKPKPEPQAKAKP